MAASEAEFQAFANGSPKAKSPVDFTIELGNFRWGVHQRVLAARSETLNLIVSLPYRDPAKSVHIVYDDCPIMFTRLLLWLYLGDSTSIHVKKSPYNFVVRCRTSNERQKAIEKDKKRTEWQVTALMYQVATKYVVADLVIAAKNALIAHIKSTPTDVAGIVELMGPNTFETDTELRTCVFRSLLPKAESMQEFNNCLRDTFQENEKLRILAQEFMFNELQSKTKVLQQLQGTVVSTTDYLKNRRREADAHGGGFYRVVNDEVCKSLVKAAEETVDATTPSNKK